MTYAPSRVSLLSAAALALGLAPTAFGQEFRSRPNVPSQYHFGVIETVAGDFNGDASPDFALIRDDEVVLVVSPALYHSVIHIPAPPVDPNDRSVRATFASGVAVDGPLGNDLVVASSLGLLRFTLHDSEGRWAPTLSNYPGQAEAEVVGALLPGSTPSLSKLRADFLEQLGDWLIVGTIGVADVNLGLLTASGSWIGLPAFTIPASYQDIALADLDDDGLPELAVAHDGGLEVKRYDGSTYVSISTPNPAVEVERIQFGTTSSGAPRDGLALVCWVEEAVHTITTMGGATIRPAVLCTGFDLKRVIALPMDSDPAPDLVLVDDTSDVLRVYQHVGSEPDLSTFTDRTVAGPGTPGALNLITAGFADVDGDSDVDLFVPSSSYEWGGMAEAATVPAASLMPTIDFSKTGWIDAAGSPTGMVNGTLRLHLGEALIPPPNTNLVEVMFWSTKVVVGPNGVPTGSAEVKHSTRVTVLASRLSAPGGADVDVPNFLFDATSPQVALADLLQTMTVRYIQQTGSGPVTNVGPCRFEYMYVGGTNTDPKFSTYLGSWSIVASPTQIGEWGPVTPNYSSEVGNSKTGSCVPGHEGPIPPGNTGS